MSNTNSKEWDFDSFLDALRPEPGWVVNTAILGTYSADFSSIAAALVALHGKGSSQGHGGDAELSEVIEALKDKVFIRLQRGRLAKPRTTIGMGSLFDQFVRELSSENPHASWHPKVALVRFSSSNSNGGEQWRFWLGSRNLTAAANRDLGLLLIGKSDRTKAPAQIPGLTDAIMYLAKTAGISSAKRKELSGELLNVRWCAPLGLKVKRICFKSEHSKTKIQLPEPPADTKEIIVVSPFLDSGFLQRVARLGKPSVKRTLISTRSALNKIASADSAALEPFSNNIRVFGAPVLEQDPPAADGEAQPEQDIAAPLARNLHAKLLAIRTTHKLLLWVGSANATERGWFGANSEIIAELEANLSYRRGLEAFRSGGSPIELDKLDTHVAEEDIKRKLEKARDQVAARWKGELTRQENRFTLSVPTDSLPHPDDEAISLSVGMGTGALTEWKREASEIFLGEQPLHLQTEFVCFRLSLEDESCEWIQCCPVKPPLDSQRDEFVVRNVVRWPAFSRWMRSLLRDELPVEQARYSAAAEHNDATGHNVPGFGDSLTIEDLLACWAKDPGLFSRCQKRLDQYLLATDETNHGNEELKDLQLAWIEVRKTLGETL